MWLVDLNYNFECYWPIELSDNKLSNNKVSNNKLSDNNLASELMENRSVFKSITIEEIVIFMIKVVKNVSNIMGLIFKYNVIGNCILCISGDDG